MRNINYSGNLIELAAELEDLATYDLKDIHKYRTFLLTEYRRFISTSAVYDPAPYQIFTSSLLEWPTFVINGLIGLRERKTTGF